MIIAVDVYYKEHRAKAVAVAFDTWQDTTPHHSYEATVTEVAEYIPGAFYKRELPCLMAVLQQVPMVEVEAIVVDGYVTLDDEGKPGLGYHLYHHFDGAIPVIGVSKTRFHDNEHPRFVREILRGVSQTPLYITAIGTDLDKAALNVQRMEGTYRIPALLKRLDQLTRQDDIV